MGVVIASVGSEVSLISTDDTFLKFYYNPQRENLRSVLGGILPDLLTGRKPVALLENKGDNMKDFEALLKGLAKAERVPLMKMIGGPV